MMSIARVYQLYLTKAVRKECTEAGVSKIICWLTGCGHNQLQSQ